MTVIFLCHYFTLSYFRGIFPNSIPSILSIKEPPDWTVPLDWIYEFTCIRDVRIYSKEGWLKNCLWSLFCQLEIPFSCPPSRKHSILLPSKKRNRHIHQRIVWTVPTGHKCRPSSQWVVDRPTQYPPLQWNPFRGWPKR